MSSKGITEDTMTQMFDRLPNEYEPINERCIFCSQVITEVVTDDYDQVYCSEDCRADAGDEHPNMFDEVEDEEPND